MFDYPAVLFLVGAQRRSEAHYALKLAFPEKKLTLKIRGVLEMLLRKKNEQDYAKAIGLHQKYG